MNEFTNNSNNNATNTQTQTNESNKIVSYTVLSLMKKMNRNEIMFNHPSQRKAGQWNNNMKGNLISDIIQGNPLPSLVLAEQVSSNGFTYLWNLDGKQRCSNIHEFINDGFKIPKSIRRNLINYQEVVTDEEGNPVLEDGIPKVEIKTFDLANKKFSQLPDVLKEKIYDYCFTIVLYLNCSDDDISYHIERYNDGKAMNTSQKGVIKLGSDFAKATKDISSSDFFDDCGCYTAKEETNGTIDRVVVETIMCQNFLDDWKKGNEAICEYLCQNATYEMFDTLQDELSELEDIVTDDHKELFNTKDSFIWFTAFHNALEKGISVDDFGDFLSACVNELKEEETEDGVSFITLASNRNTKDKSLIVQKLNHIDTLLDRFVS